MAEDDAAKSMTPGVILAVLLFVALLIITAIYIWPQILKLLLK